VLATGPAVPDPTPEQQLLRVRDDRVRLIAVTGQEPGAVLVRLQSFADEPVTVPIEIGVPVAGAATATFLGDRIADLTLTDGAVTVRIPRLGTAAVLLQTGR
jgi:hypothetical protein